MQMRWLGDACSAFILLVVAACEPPAKVATPPKGATVSGESSARPLATASAVRSTEPAPSVPVAQASTALAGPPCPPEAPAPAGAQAWVNGCKIELNERIYFDIEKATIKPQSYPVLDAVGDILTRDAELHVEIQGHLGEPQRHAYGRSLSRSRADSVRKYLIAKKGIEPNRLMAKGYEAEKPIADWRTEEGRKHNRRIEFVIWKWSGGGSR